MNKIKILFLLFTAICIFSCKKSEGQETASGNENDFGQKQQSEKIFEVVSSETIIDDSLRKLDLENVSIYRWKNHLAFFSKSADLDETRKILIAAFPDAEIRIYDKYFYEFNREECADATISERQTHVVMTCNLVSDSIMQAEYMNYHARQRELFPEVAKGFCNAGFQSLLVFRNGRQLMLVISLPEGKTLDELNPKTTENNPRADEWNTLMSHYQEGIEGTEPSESWVIMEEIKF